MRRFVWVCVLLSCLPALSQQRAVAAAAAPDWPAGGAYATSHGIVYVARLAEPPDHPVLQFYDPASRRVGDLVQVSKDRYRSAGAPHFDVLLRHPLLAAAEERREIDDEQGRFGFSLWHGAEMHRPLIVLLEGADDCTRDMGFLIPYFVAHGMAVLTFDQRGTGISTGDWHFMSPEAKAQDVVAALQSISGDALIDPSRMGVWGPSNGGWVAPIVAARIPLAFMILKSGASQPISDNVLYEIRQELLRNASLSSRQRDDALRFERLMLESVRTNGGWDEAGAALEAARKAPWFSSMRIPPDLTIPLAPPVLAGFQASLIYDPAPVLEKTTVATLALFGGLDRNVDAPGSAALYRDAFSKAGMRDFTVHIFPHADHLLVESTSGYTDDEPKPARFAPGYPEIMIDWLRQRGLSRCGEIRRRGPRGDHCGV